MFRNGSHLSHECVLVECGPNFAEGVSKLVNFRFYHKLGNQILKFLVQIKVGDEGDLCFKCSNYTCITLLNEFGVKVNKTQSLVHLIWFQLCALDLVERILGEHHGVGASLGSVKQ